ncbi:Protein of unknown function [Leuconostoc citreum]|nr:Protein of unknown function [Leuconostoc citreum LBAE C10]CCF26770.1 Protein of unknown function [Leuconostoc citreum LBAE C11]CCF28209.1 Protein of unknown function [Leuconostoc citreum LBAE E16]CDX64236.1 Protein of unknown function [Leuconostoc citreum]CDX65957.1 Protein of unknown function [Leuconostoc citreum]
MGFFVATGLD